MIESEKLYNGARDLGKKNIKDSPSSIHINSHLTEPSSFNFSFELTSKHPLFDELVATNESVVVGHPKLVNLVAEKLKINPSKL